MREHLLGFLIRALEDGECSEIESCIQKDPQLQQDAQRLHAHLEPLRCDADHHPAPNGLAARTCSMVVQRASQTEVAPAPPGWSFRSWRMIDVVVAAGALAACAALFLPGLLQSTAASQLTRCQENLRELHSALSRYAARHGGYFPEIGSSGGEAVAGIYAVRLVTAGDLIEHERFVCPASSLAGLAHAFRAPTLQELRAATGQRLLEMQSRMGGSYGYTLGYVDNGRYRPTKYLGRERFAILADAFDPSVNQSCNHGGCGQNALFENGRILYVTSCDADGTCDDIFRNDRGTIAAGLHVDDAVIASSAASPLPQALRPLLTPAVRRLD
jgi:hypothetical protein